MILLPTPATANTNPGSDNVLKRVKSFVKSFIKGSKGLHPLEFQLADIALLRLAFATPEEGFSDQGLINLAASRASFDRAFNSRTNHLLNVAGSDKLRRWANELFSPLAVALGCAPKPSKSITGSEIVSFYHDHTFHTVHRSDEDIQKDITDFIAKVRAPDFEADTLSKTLSQLSQIIPLASLFILAGKRSTQTLSEAWKELKIYIKTEAIADRLLKHSLLHGTNPLVLAAALKHIFSAAQETRNSDAQFPKELAAHRPNTLIQLIDTVRTNADLNSAKFANLGWGAATFDEARTGKKKKTTEKATKPASRTEKRTQTTKKATGSKKRTKPTKAQPSSPDLEPIRGAIPKRVCFLLVFLFGPPTT